MTSHDIEDISFTGHLHNNLGSGADNIGPLLRAGFPLALWQASRLATFLACCVLMGQTAEMTTNLSKVRAELCHCELLMCETAVPPQHQSGTAVSLLTPSPCHCKRPLPSRQFVQSVAKKRRQRI